MEKIIQICSQNDYQYITNFEWYISVLVELTRMEGTSHGPLIAAQMMDVAIRVETIRPFAVRQMALLVENYHLLLGEPTELIIHKRVHKKVSRAQRIINLEIPVLVRSLKSSNVELG